MLTVPTTRARCGAFGSFDYGVSLEAQADVAPPGRAQFVLVLPFRTALGALDLDRSTAMLMPRKQLGLQTKRCINF